MKCNKILPLLSRQIDSDLNWVQRKMVFYHLSRCEACASELRLMQRTSNLTRSAMTVADQSLQDTDLWEAIEEELPKTDPCEAADTAFPAERQKVLTSPAGARSWKKWSPAVVGLAVLLIFSLWLKPRQTGILSPDSPEAQISELPVVEEVFNEGVTVMTFKTSDPKITVVWFFQEVNSEENEVFENGGVS